MVRQERRNVMTTNARKVVGLVAAAGAIASVWFAQSLRAPELSVASATPGTKTPLLVTHTMAAGPEDASDCDDDSATDEADEQERQDDEVQQLQQQQDEEQDALNQQQLEESMQAAEEQNEEAQQQATQDQVQAQESDPQVIQNAQQG